MPQPLRVVETEDPRRLIEESVGWAVETIEPLGAEILLVMYERGKQRGEVKTTGGIIVPEMKTGALAEDKYQGKAGLLMRMGPLAFTEDGSHRWGGRTPRPGDWVLVNINDTFAFDLPGDRRARIVEDVNVRAILQRPDVVW